MTLVADAVRVPPKPPRVPQLAMPAVHQHRCVRCIREFPCTARECLALTFTLCPECLPHLGLS